MVTDAKTIRVIGAAEHNLKSVSMSIPRDEFIVITGVSGSGKSSLAFDTIFAEGQRKYMESLSSYARQFLNQMDKPNVESIEGLPPTIAIAQRSSGHNPRSTVATTTEIYDYLRLLMARCATPRCWHLSKSGTVCGLPIQSTTITQIIDALMSFAKGTKMMICAPIVTGKKGYHRTVLESLRSDGFVRARVNGNIVDLREVLLDESDNPLNLGRYEMHTIEAVVDRIVIDENQRERIADSVEVAVKLGAGSLLVLKADGVDWKEYVYSEHFACSKHPECNLPELEPRLFSFNSHYGACRKCDGLGSVHEFDPALIIPDHSKSLNKGAIVPWHAYGPAMRRKYGRKIRKFCDIHGIDTTISFGELSKKQRTMLLEGGSLKGSRAKFEGVIPNLQRRFKQTESDHVRSLLMTCMTHMQCPDCLGERLRIEARSVTVESSGKHYSITQLTSLTIAELLDVVNAVELTAEQSTIAEPILKEIKSRLTFLVSVGLDYLSLNRTSSTLSGGESQRIRLATQVGSGLVGVCYVLDEPTIGLHARDNERLLKTLHHLSTIGNTVIVVEHDEEIIRSADHIVDVGPHAGLHGGQIVCQGSLDEVLKHKDSLTSKYLNGSLAIPLPSERRKVALSQALSIKTAIQNNLKEVDVDIPLNVMTCVTGVSGSGKSSLVNQVLLKQVSRLMKGDGIDKKLCESIKGIENIDRLIEVDQSPIGRTPRSNPATYTGIFDHIRALFTQTREAKIRGYKPGRFSFNVKGGRCESCQGQGVKRIEMHFLPDTYVTCEECDGARYNNETLEVKWRGYTISDILNSTIEDACEIFGSHPKIARMLDCLKDVGLSYLTLGQPSTTLSGGEAQRVKLASELGVQSRKQTLYVLDEPTTGLHFADIDKLLLVLHRLVDAGNTVVIIEHNLDIIKNADWLIDLGPEGGDCGGEIVCIGTPEQVASHKSSFTGKALKGIIKVKQSTSRKRKTCSSKS